jgi:N-hydroxyarylamine O-acetyltransferase
VSDICRISPSNLDSVEDRTRIGTPSEMNTQQLTGYLERVALDAPPDRTLAGASALHRAHLLRIPFESLDIHLGVEITLDVDSLREKLVDRRRGGFCYENNLLFADALHALGLRVDLLSARVANTDGYGPPFDHMVLRAELDGREHLLDVGFGEGFRCPLRIDGEWHQESPSAPYRVVPVESEFRVEHRDGDTVVADYLVDPTPREAGDFAEMCRYQQTSPDSGFRSCHGSSSRRSMVRRPRRPSRRGLSSPTC